MKDELVERVARVIHDECENDDESGGGAYMRAARTILAALDRPATVEMGEVKANMADRVALQAAWDEYASWMGDPDGKDDTARAFNEAAKVIARHRLAHSAPKEEIGASGASGSLSLRRPLVLQPIGQIP